MKKITRDFTKLNTEELYSNDLLTEYTQSVEEGLDIEKFKPLFDAVIGLPAGEAKEKAADAVFDYVLNAGMRDGYGYNEPSELDEIRKLCKVHKIDFKKISDEELKNKITGAWLGRVCGCLLGKPVEGMRNDELVPFLKGAGNYPMTRYILSSDVREEDYEKYRFGLRDKCWADTVDGMPVDDDTNYTVLYQYVVDRYGKDFTSENIADSWLSKQPKSAYFTAEQVAFRNFINGYSAPGSAIYKNPFREWIGAQIRGDYFGYINPAEPEKAAEMAFRDARISHVKNGIYGEMFAAAMIACAAACDDMEDIVLGGLSQIPETSRLYAEVMHILNCYRGAVPFENVRDHIHGRYDEHSSHGWCHTISNAMIVTAALLYGEGDFGRSICLAVQTGFDTDCNGATVGSVVGMKNGADNIDENWTKPLRGKINTSIVGIGTVMIDDCVNKTLEHIGN